MKNYLVITLGTRDVQLRKDLIESSEDWIFSKEINVKDNRETYFVQKGSIKLQTNAPNSDFPNYLTVSPRLAGKEILDKYNDFKEIIDLPLIIPTIKKLTADSKKIDVVLTVYTNQEFEKDIIKKHFYNNDTLFFNDIVVKYLKEQGLLTQSDFDEYGILEQVANIDYQYQHFAEAQKESLFGKNITPGEIFLLAQGGIDQINHAITLQLIQAFKHNVRLFQQPESSEPIELNFAHQFLTDLNKQKIQEHLDKYNFGLITDDLTLNTEIVLKAKYANSRLNLGYNELSGQFTEEDKCKDLYLASKIVLQKQNNPLEFLWRLFTINENLFKIEIEKIIGNSRAFYVSGLGKNDKNIKWEKVLNDLDEDLIQYLVKKRVIMTNPNRWAFKSMYIYLTRKGIIPQILVEKRKCVGDKIELLAVIDKT